MARSTSPTQESRRGLNAAMALVTSCVHSFKLVKSDNTLIQWTCNICHSGPHWCIFECRYCKLHTCRACTQSA